MGRTIFILMFSFLISTSSWAQSNWQITDNMYGGDIRNIAKTPNGILFAGLQDGSLYRKKPDQSWEKLLLKTNDLWHYNFPGILVVSDSIIFISQGGARVKKTINAGDTWSEIENHPIKNGNLTKNNSNHIFHLGYGPYNLSVSNDLGISWTIFEFDSNVGGTGEIKFAHNDSVWIIGSYYGVLVSYTEGANWEQRNNGLPQYTHIYSVNVNCDNEILIGTNNGVYFTNDLGLNWIPRNDGLSNSIVIRDLYNENDSTIYAGTNSGVYFTSDYGLTWQNFNPGINFLDVLKIIKDNNSLLLSTKESLYKADTSNFSFFDDGISDVQVNHFDEFNNRIYTGTNRGIFYTNLTEAYWQQAESTRKLPVIDISKSKNNIYVAQRNQLYFSDIENTWTNYPFPFPCLNILSAEDDKLLGGFYRSIPGQIPEGTGIHLSFDQGVSWYYQYFFIERIYLLEKDWMDNIYSFSTSAMDGTDYIRKSIDNGETFIDFSQGFPATFDFQIYCLETDKNLNQYIASQQGIYFRSQIDTAWILKGLSGQDVISLAVDSSGTLYAALKNTVYYSNDLGETFTPFNEGIPQVNISTIFYSHKNNTLFLGTELGAFTRNAPDLTSIKNAELELPQEYKLTVYPNPFNNSAKINFSLTEKSNVKIFLYNTLGEKLLELTNSIYESGEHSVPINGSSLSSGVYLCQIHTEKFNKTIKLVLLK
ncbi:MAG: T9SS type A sorting domain-containing protein [Ignavibacteriae bacterium]|nr:T9SS C-terminal target domain-containing protein [Ignavibacteriota bacterium]NOG96687.1 T9SS type A sorting domain-containing protein [Ignavibacteriota bacterium]